MKTTKILSLFAFTLILVFSSCEDKITNKDLQFNSWALGCRSFSVYKINADNTLGIAVIGNREKLFLSTEEQIFYLSETKQDELKVVLQKYNFEASSHFCSDYNIVGSKLLDTWTAISGNVKAKITQDAENIPPKIGEVYKVDVTIENVILKNSKGNKIFIQHLEFLDVWVNILLG